MAGHITKRFKRMLRIPGMHTDRSGTPKLRGFPAATGTPHTVVLVLHGGKAHSQQRVRPRQLAYLRMVPFARLAHRAASETGTAVWLLRNRLRGWNGPAMDAVQDARWALSEIARVHPDARVVLAGHSMGGRAALRLAGDPQVTAVCALAPWIESGEPTEQLADRTVLVVHGDRDRITSQSASQSYARRATAAGHDVRYVVIPGVGHSMLRKRVEWEGHVRRFVRATTTGETDPESAVDTAEVER